MILNEIKNEILQGYNGVFKMSGTIAVRKINKTSVRFRNNKNFQTYIISLDENDHESDSAIFTGYIHKLETPVFNLVNPSGFGKGTDYRGDNVGVVVDNCYIPTSK